MSKHTPGPWRLGSTARIIMAGFGRRIAAVPQYAKSEEEADENRANAWLIAAAPDLLAACEKADTLHGLVEGLALTLRNALPMESSDESVAVRQDRLEAKNTVAKADAIINAIRAAIAIAKPPP